MKIVKEGPPVKKGVDCLLNIKQNVCFESKYVGSDERSGAGNNARNSWGKTKGGS